MSHFHIPMGLAAAAALAAAMGVAGTPAHASLTLNALTATGSALEDLDGVAVEAATVAFEAQPITPGDEDADNSRSRRQDVAFEPQPEPPGLEDW